MSRDQQEDRASWWRLRLVGSAALLVVLVAAAVLFVMIATDPGDNVSLIETGTETRGPDRFITGSLRNNTDGPYARAQVEISLLDENGEVVERISATAIDFGAGETWNFEVPVLADDAVRYRVEKLTCSPSSDSSDWEEKRSCAIAAGSTRSPYVGDL